MTKQLGLPVKIIVSKTGTKGEVSLHFQSEEDLNRIINKLK
ncbi:Chromosome (plasmid) partitioning protein ParB / Stage 0 sporulation protein J [Streptococcus gallolyticus]|uniref:Chromosome (Plasmid) partitioning protein ParB / Stage 0 sporulation protein J n=1 Tax=Streptococcus gallolyticus TaxID=315405 RepID=A0A139NB55_9STRE|nr:Chromosome (plasmid) partitioning protein ParB / Stage 0 sporulation protein J [Streptococcus gallolyticus]